MKLEKLIEEYENDARELYEDLQSSVSSNEALISDIELLWYSRYGLKGEKVLEVDRKYLPSIYRKIKELHPEIAEYFKAKMVSAGAPSSIFSTS